ncbi:DIA1 protein, partial [Peucedramus taeniatus]|nr:DIA1 protein [Peucedramus taeniatus]
SLKLGRLYRYVKLAVLGSLAAALVLNTHSLLASLQRNELSERRFLQLNKCPACWGTSWCRKFLNGQLRLESWGRLRLLDFFNVKNVWFSKESKAKQGIHSAIPMGRQVLSHCQDSRAPSYGMVTWEDKRCHSGCVSFLLLPPASHADHDAIWNRIFLGSAGVSCPDCVPSQLLVHPIPLAGGGSFPSDEGWPFAKYLGACGRMVAVNYVGEELWSYFNAPWEKRVDLAWQLMEIAEQLTNNDFEFALYLLDVSFDNFAVGPRDGKVIIVDAENVLVADKRLIRQNKPENWDVWYESKFDDCDKEACLSFSKEILCARVTVDHNYYAICQNLLSRHATWRGTSGGLLHDPPAEIAKEGRLEALLDECANPKKRYGRFQAAKELREYLAQLSNNVR